MKNQRKSAGNHQFKSENIAGLPTIQVFRRSIKKNQRKSAGTTLRIFSRRFSQIQNSQIFAD